MDIFKETKIGEVKLKNRIFRSGTFEGMCDKEGIPNELYYSMYEELARNELGAIITGFTYISREGKAMQPGQAGIDSEEKVPFFRKLTDLVHRYNCRIFLQIAHTGRQTRSVDTGMEVVGCSDKRSFYFKDKPRKLNRTEIVDIINRFGNSALYSKNAGFDGVQIHAAHGYLIHQFLLSNINNRKDEYGINPETGIGTKFLEGVINNIRDKCGLNFPVLVKISGGVDYKNSFSEEQFIHLIRFFEQLKVDGIEISYGTMDYALNIFRGDLPLDLVLAQNPIYRTKNKLKKRFWKTFVLPVIKAKLKPFSLMYNLDYASIAKQVTVIPVISVGGFRSYGEIDYAIRNRKTDLVSLCRPLICEPDFVRKIKEDHCYLSQCTSCNYCAIMCDTKNYTKCYQKQKNGTISKNSYSY